jgi:hypothetical protein
MPHVLGQSQPATKPLHTVSNLTPDALFNKVSKSVFIVEAVDSHGDAVFQQSGVAISPHVIASSKAILGTFANLSISNDKAVARYRLRQNNRTWIVNNVFVDSQRDISTFESSDLTAQPLQTAKFDSISTGERIYAVSFPKGQEETLTEGTVSSLDSVNSATPIHTNISLGSESAGGGIFDVKGRMICLIAYNPQSSLNMGIPIEWFQRPRILYSGKESPDKQSDASKKEVKELDSEALTVTGNIRTFAQLAMMHRDKLYVENDEHLAIVTANVNSWALVDENAPENYHNWPVWRKALESMELIRTQIDSASESDALETSESGMKEVSSRNLRMVVDGGKKIWSKVLDLYCREVPSGLYTDLDGKERACAPAH